MRVIFLAFVALIFSACATTQTAPDPYASYITIAKPLSAIKVKDIRYKKDSGGLTLAQATLINGGTSADIVYRVQWYDENNFMQNGISKKWKAIKANGKSEFSIQAISPSVKASKFHIYLDKKSNYSNDEILN